MSFTTWWVPPRKPPDTMRDLYYCHNFDLKIRVDICTRVYVVPVEFVTFSQEFHLMVWFFQFINRISVMWAYLMWCIIDLLFWIVLWTKLRIYKVPPDPFRWYCRGFVYLWRKFVMICIIWYKNDPKVSHRMQFNATSKMKLATSLISFECHTCGKFEGFS